MGLISRVSSRTYRRVFFSIMRRLLLPASREFSTFKSASELWASAAPPHPNKQARGKRTTVKKLIDFQQGHNVGEVEGELIKGLHEVPSQIQARAINNNKSTVQYSLKSMTMKLDQKEMTAKASLKADREAERLARMNEEKIKDMEATIGRVYRVRVI